MTQQPTQSRFNVIKAALALELENYGKTLADFEADLLKTAADKKDEKKDGGKGPLRLVPPLVNLGFVTGKGVINTMGQGAVLAGQQAARIDEKMDNDDKPAAALASRKAVLEKAIANLKAKHPHIN